MNAILGYGQLLHRDVNPALTDRQRRSVEQIMQAGHHLLDLIDEVLKLGQINAGTIEVDRIDIAVRPMLEDCIGLIQPDAAKRLISIENRTSNMRGVAFIGDNVRVKEVLLNLLSNAVKYNVMHGRIVLTAHRTSDDMIRISVADTGPGIPSDQVERVFDPFTRLESSGENIPGTGIGLTIAKQMVELMGGRIGCTAESDAGTEFWFELPASMTVVDTAANALAGGDAASDASEDAEKNYTLLYVEDNATNQELLRDICSLRPEFSLHCADDAEAGLDVLRHQSIDLVIMDIKLPGIDGFEALRMIRQQPASVAIPVIALSASAMSTDIKRGMEAGFSRYLTKPIDVDQILTAVDQIREEGTVEI
jgi:CheY-like chemotaxis protein